MLLLRIIGYRRQRSVAGKRIIAVIDDDGSVLVMLNPRLIHWSGPYETEEGCLSLPGTRSASRFERITVGYDDELLRSCMVERSGRVAQAIQHGIGYCNSALICAVVFCFASLEQCHTGRKRSDAISEIALTYEASSEIHANCYYVIEIQIARLRAKLDSDRLLSVTDDWA